MSIDRGKLIVVDGLDGTGKQTQVEMLKDYFIQKGKVLDKDFAVVDFPRYGKESCHMVESYLHGLFGTKPDNIDPYTASMFYAIDRSLSFKTESWGEVYRNGGLVIADRYTSSNIIHQASKLLGIFKDENELYYFARSPVFCNYIRWLYDTEYKHIKLPIPDMIIYLNLSEEANQKMLDQRSTYEAKDIHEKNVAYLNKCRKILKCYEYLVKDSYTQVHYEINYKILHSFIRADDENHSPRSRESVHHEIITQLSNMNMI